MALVAAAPGPSCSHHRPVTTSHNWHHRRRRHRQRQNQQQQQRRQRPSDQLERFPGWLTRRHTCLPDRLRRRSRIHQVPVVRQSRVESPSPERKPRREGGFAASRHSRRLSLPHHEPIMAVSVPSRRVPAAGTRPRAIPRAVGVTPAEPPIPPRRPNVSPVGRSRPATGPALRAPWTTIGAPPAGSNACPAVRSPTRPLMTSDAALTTLYPTDTWAVSRRLVGLSDAIVHR